MKKQPQLVRDDNYEGMASTFQILQTAKLDEALRNCAVTDREVRRRVCEYFMTYMSDFYDHCWFRYRDDRIFPMICFAKRFLDRETDPSDIGTVLVPSAGWTGLSQAHNSIEDYFTDDDLGDCVPELGAAESTD